MKAVAFENKHKMAVLSRPKPHLKSPTDALLRVTTAGICGSDLHMYDGRTTLKKDTVVGHEIIGHRRRDWRSGIQYKERGSCRSSFQYSLWILRELSSRRHACLPDDESRQSRRRLWLYRHGTLSRRSGGVCLGSSRGFQLPEAARDRRRRVGRFLLLSDVFPTGYHATELAGVGPGKTVAILGAGPVGLLAAHSALLKGASEVYVVDGVTERLKKAAEFGATPVDLREGDPAEQIFVLRAGRRAHKQSLRPGEEKARGVDCAIDAVGYQARSDENPSTENPTQTLENCIRVVNSTGHMGIIGVFLAPDPDARNEDSKKGIFRVPLADIFDKALTIGSGQAPVKRYNEYLRELIVSGRAKPGKIVSHHIQIEEVPEAYEKFDQRADGYVKVLIRFVADHVKSKSAGV